MLAEMKTNRRGGVGVSVGEAAWRLVESPRRIRETVRTIAPIAPRVGG
jgi:hypothetical protein